MMALRFILVGLVASLGFQMPGVEDVESWTRNGRIWVEARLADVTCLRIEAERAFAEASDCERVDQPQPAPVAEVGSTRDDLTFDAVVDGMAKDFIADLALMEQTKAVEEALTVVEPFREMPEAVPSPSQSEVPGTETVAETRLERVEEPARILAPVQMPTSRVEKISTAVRLTRQAMSAWAALIQPASGEVNSDDQEDLF